jgi:hypothetical protein
MRERKIPIVKSLKLITWAFSAISTGLLGFGIGIWSNFPALGLPLIVGGVVLIALVVFQQELVKGLQKHEAFVQQNRKERTTASEGRDGQ